MWKIYIKYSCVKTRPYNKMKKMVVDAIESI